MDVSRRPSGLVVPPPHRDHSRHCSLFGGALAMGGSGGPPSIWGGYNGALDGAAVLAFASVPWSSNNNTVISCGAAMLTDIKGVAVWPSGWTGSVWTQLNCCVFAVSGTSISIGSVQTVAVTNLTNENGTTIRLIRLDSTRALLTYDYYAGSPAPIRAYGAVLTVNASADVVSVGSLASAGDSANAPQNTSFRLSATQFVTVGYRAVLWTVSGTTATPTFALPESAPYGHRGAGRIDDTHFWIETVASDQTGRRSVYSVSGTTCTEVLGVAEPWGYYAASYPLGPTGAIIGKTNSSGVITDYGRVDFNPATYAMTRLTYTSLPPASLPSGNPAVMLTDAHLIADTSSGYNRIRVQTFNTGDSAMSAPVNVAPTGSAFGCRDFPTTPNKVLAYYGVGQSLYLKILRAV